CSRSPSRGGGPLSVRSRSAKLGKERRSRIAAPEFEPALSVPRRFEVERVTRSTQGRRDIGAEIVRDHVVELAPVEHSVHFEPPEQRDDRQADSLLLLITHRINPLARRWTQTARMAPTARRARASSSFADQ